MSDARTESRERDGAPAKGSFDRGEVGRGDQRRAECSRVKKDGTLVGLTRTHRPASRRDKLAPSEGQETMPTVKARFANGELGPLEVLELKDGQQAMVSIDGRLPPRRVGRGTRAAAGAWKGTHDPEKFKRGIYAARRVRRRPRAGRRTLPLISCGLVC